MHRKLSALLSLILILAVALAESALARTPEDYDAANPAQLSSDMLYSQAAVLIDASSGDVLFGKNERDRMNPASTTKIMTLLLGIESGIPLEQQIAIPQAAASIPGDSSLIPVYPGETMSFGDLLLGFMLASGNDGANAVAVLVSGSVDGFVELMNRRAVEIGCTDTHFANAHGYTDENHYTTAYDLALITREAMKNATFRQIVNNYRGTITVNERGELNLVSKYEIMKPTSKFYYEGCIGVKTGTTSAAGECFVGAAEKDGATLISVALKSAKTEEEEYRWIDTARLFDFGWTCYDTYTLDQMFEVAESQLANVVISNASKDDPYGGRLDLEIAQISDTSYLRMVERNSATALSDAVSDFCSKASIQLTRESLTAPISKGEIIGEFSYLDASTGSIVTAKVVAGRDVAEQIDPPTLLDYFPFLRIFSNKIFLALLIVLAVLIVLIVILALSRRAAKQRRRRMIYEQRRREYQRRQQSAVQTRRRDPYDEPPRRPRSASGSTGRSGTRTPPSRTSSGRSGRPGSSGYDRRRPR